MRRIVSWVRKQRLDKSSRTKIQFIEKITGCHIWQPQLFLRALRHRSRLVESNMRHNESYEQLEFLGDAVLDLIVTEVIFERFHSRNEGFMTQMRSRIVKGETLAKFSVYHNLSSIIEVGERVKDQGIQHSSSVLADIFEALIGAMYRDCGYEAARNFVTSTIEDVMDIKALELKRDNYKSMLLELTQGRKLPAPVYRIQAMTGPDHDRTFEIQVMLDDKGYGKGIGKNKKAAEQIAAQETLGLLESEFYSD
jgi:ribonuclease III